MPVSDDLLFRSEPPQMGRADVQSYNIRVKMQLSITTRSFSTFESRTLPAVVRLGSRSGKRESWAFQNRHYSLSSNTLAIQVHLEISLTPSSIETPTNAPEIQI